MRIKENEKLYTMPAVFGPAVCGLQGPDGKPFGGVLSNVDQYVMAYRVEQELLRKLLPQGYRSLRPVLRINVERLHDVSWLGGRDLNRVELNTPVEVSGKKGWFNLVTWEDDCDSVVYGREIYGIPKAYAAMDIRQDGAVTEIKVRSGSFVFLNISFTRVGKAGGCPKEDDNDGTFHYRYTPSAGSFPENAETLFVPVEPVDGNKEYCDCRFQWQEPAFADMPVGFQWVRKIRAIENQEILGAYVVSFDRTQNGVPQII